MLVDKHFFTNRQARKAEIQLVPNASSSLVKIGINNARWVVYVDANIQETTVNFPKVMQ